MTDFYKTSCPPDLPFRELGGAPAAVTGKRLRTWLLQLRNSHCMFQDSLRSLVDTVLDGYSKARHGAEVSVFECDCLTSRNVQCNCTKS